MLNLDNNYSSSGKVYFEPVRPIITNHSAKLCKKMLKKSIQNLADRPELPTFDSLQPIGHSQKAWNRLPLSFSKLDAITPIQICIIFLSNSIMGQLVANTDSYTQQQLLGPEKEWQHCCIGKSANRL
jgi:hypothetical protein